MEQAADGIVITEVDGKIQYVNPAFTTLTGYTRQEAVGQYTRVLKSGRHPATFYQELWSTVRSGRVWHGEVINRRKNGSLYYEEMQISPVQGAGGEITSYIAIKRDVSERHAAEETRRFLAAIVENSEDSIIAYTPAGIILTWNRGAERIFGYSSGDVVGKHVSMVIPPERHHELRYFTDQVVQGKSVPQFEGLGLRKDGSRFHISVTGCPITNFAGEVTAVSTILRDISERKEAEQARALLASIVESSEEAIIGANLDGTIISWNRGSELLFGYSSHEIIGKNVDALGPAHRAKQVHNILNAIRKGRTLRPFETVCYGKGVQQIDVLITTSPIRDSAGEVVGSSAFVRDIRKRLRAERQLRESEERFREVFAHAPFGMCVVGLDARIVQVNEALCRMIGYTAAELLDTSWFQLCHPDDLEASLQRIEHLRQDPGQCLEVEKRLIHRAGNAVWGRMRVSSVRDAGGNALYLIIHLEDVTERKRSEEALRESEERFQIMADGCPTIMWVTDAEGGNQFVNRTYREFFNTTYEQSGRSQVDFANSTRTMH